MAKKKSIRSNRKDTTEKASTPLAPTAQRVKPPVLAATAHSIFLHWIAITVILILLIGLIVGIMLFQGNRPTATEALAVLLDGTSSPSSISLQREGDQLLLEAQSLLRLLGFQGQWIYHVLPRREFRFQNKQGDTAGMQEGSLEAQFYSNVENRLEKITMECGPVVSKKDVFVPVAFAERWLGISVSYDAAQNTLSIERMKQPDPPRQQTPIAKPEEDSSKGLLDSGWYSSAVEDAQTPNQASFEHTNSDNEDNLSSEAISAPPESSPEQGDASSPEAEPEPVATPDEISIPADWIDCSYEVGGRTVAVYAVHRDGGYRFVNAAGELLVGMVYGDIGSPSQTDRLTYRAPDGQAAGVIAGLRNTDGTMLYGVISFEDGAQWIVPCYYDDLWEDEDGNFVGHIYGGGDGSVG